MESSIYVWTYFETLLTKPAATLGCPPQKNVPKSRILTTKQSSWHGLFIGLVLDVERSRVGIFLHLVRYNFISRIQCRSQADEIAPCLTQLKVLGFWVLSNTNLVLPEKKHSRGEPTSPVVINWFFELDHWWRKEIGLCRSSAAARTDGELWLWCSWQTSLWVRFSIEFQTMIRFILVQVSSYWRRFLTWSIISVLP